MGCGRSHREGVLDRINAIEKVQNLKFLKVDGSDMKSGVVRLGVYQIDEFPGLLAKLRVIKPDFRKVIARVVLRPELNGQIFAEISVGLETLVERNGMVKQRRKIMDLLQFPAFANQIGFEKPLYSFLKKLHTAKCYPEGLEQSVCRMQPLAREE